MTGTMETRELTVRLLTPTFLGNANQEGQWRTPPFKAQLRQWWRVRWAAAHDFVVDIAKMHREEGLLFGNAWLQDEFCKSKVRLRLIYKANPEQSWARGTQKGVDPMTKNLSTSYAWYGIDEDDQDKKGKKGKKRTALKTESSEGERTLALAFPAERTKELEETLALMHHFGQVGTRSRGGWGSYQLEGFPALDPGFAQRFTLPLDDCLKQDWPCAIAEGDGGPMLWESQETFAKWHEAMAQVAIARRDIRNTIKSEDKSSAKLLGSASPRFPSPLRWKVVEREWGQLAVRVFAMPYGGPVSYSDPGRVWRKIEQQLDALKTLRLKRLA
ncbi:MAG: hypothetical protein KatS3mg121_0489 [Gammaproteobacteria bacterium]|nr:MAG: hypothetical protein KatS3mg121_0489 [Gammaproteobacteria bacterium]